MSMSSSITPSRKNPTTPGPGARKVSALRGLYKYLTNNVGLIPTNPIEKLELPTAKQALPTYLNLEQCYDLLRTFDQADPNHPRDYCIVTLFLNCGMRLSEMSGLNVNSFRDNTLRVLGKGNKERMLYLNDACMAAMKTYLEYRSQLTPIRDTDAMFLNRTGHRLGQRRIEQIITEHLDRAGLSHMGFSTHKLRHTAATMMYQYGDVDVKVLQEILGHVHLNTTEIYTHVSDKQKEAALSSSPWRVIRRNRKNDKSAAEMVSAADLFVIEKSIGTANRRKEAPQLPQERADCRFPMPGRSGSVLPGGSRGVRIIPRRQRR